MNRRDRAAAAAARTRAALCVQRQARHQMARTARPPKAVPDFHAIMARLERGATPAELLEAEAALAQPPAAPQLPLL